VEDVFQGWYEAFTQLGIKTIDYNLQDRLTFYAQAYLDLGEDDENGHKKFKKAFSRQDDVIGVAANQVYSTCYRWWPDLVLIISDFFVPDETVEILRSRGHKVVILFTESPYEEPKQVKRAQHADLVLLNDPSRLDLYEQAGIPAYYAPHAYRPSLHYPGAESVGLETDFAFIGTAFPSRIEFFEKMHAAGAFDRIDVTLGGFWGNLPEESPLSPYLAHDRSECVDNDQTASIYRSAKVGINFYRRSDGDSYQDGVACGPREVEMAACGLPFLRDPRPESDELFGEILPTFDSPEQAAEQLAWWLAHDDERMDAGMAVRRVIRPRTFQANVQKLLKLLDEL
jgi:spore maturation protein CgeB